MRLLLTFQPVITRNNCSSDSPVIVRIGRPCKPTPLSGSMPAKGCIYIDIVFTQPEQSAVIPFVSGKVRPVVLCVNLPYHSFIKSITELDSSGKHPVRLLEIPPARINLVIQTQVLIIQVNRQGASVKSLCAPSTNTDNGSVHSDFIDLAVIFCFQWQDCRKRFSIFL